MKTRIIVDSTSDLTPDIREKVYVIPMTVCFGAEEYIDGVTISHQEFYEKLVELDVHPTTSQATPAAFEAEYKKAEAAGEAAVVITVSSGFSGTYQSARIAAEGYENVYVVDGNSVAVGGGILVARAVQLLSEGLSAGALAQRLEEEKKDIVIIALVDTLEYLKRGGRISKTVAFAGTLLNIKPVLSVVRGEIEIVGKARGSKQGSDLLTQEIGKAGGVDFARPVLLGYAGLTDEPLRKYISDSEQLWKDNLPEVPYTSIGSSIGAHVGPGAVAVAFFKKKP